MRLAPEYHDFDTFCTEIGIDSDTTYDFNPLVAQPTTTSDSSVTKEGSEFQEGDEVTDDDWRDELPTQREFSLAGPQSSAAKSKAPVVIVLDEEDRSESVTPTTELLIYHYKFGHISFQKLQAMAKLRILPRRLASCHTPTCSACMYAKVTKRPWRQKTRQTSEPPKPMKPGDVVSVDQMVPPYLDS